MTDEPKRWGPVSKDISIQFRITPQQKEMLDRLSERWGDRPNNIARALFTTALIGEETRLNAQTKGVVIEP